LDGGLNGKKNTKKEKALDIAALFEGEEVS